MRRLIIEGNSVYEVDEECLKQKEKQKEAETKQRNDKQQDVQRSAKKE